MPSDSPFAPIITAPIIIAHRGASAVAPENTIAAFTQAIEFQAEMIEFDVRRTQDRVLVVHHDPAIQGRLIADLTWQEIQTLAPEVPTVEAAIVHGKGRIQFDVELKEVGYEAEVLDLLLRHLPIHDFIITSFNFASLQQVRSMHKTVQIGLLLVERLLSELLLASQSNLRDQNLCDQNLSDQLSAIEVNFILPHWSLIDSPLLLQHMPQQLPIIVWTVNDLTMAQALMQRSNLFGIVTDYPDRLLNIRSSRSS